MLPYCVRTSFALPAYPTKHTKFQSVCRSLHYDHEASTVQSRRSALATAAATAALLLCPSTAGASPLTDYLRQKIRPELDPLAAVIQMLDARGTLLEVRELPVVLPA